MSDKVSKRGRPIGSSQYPEDREALKHMYVLRKEGMPVLRAAESAVQKMERPRPSEARAIDRIRKKFTEFFEEKERVEKEKASHSRPRQYQAWNIPSAQDLEQARQHSALVRTPEFRAAMRQLVDNKGLLGESIFGPTRSEFCELRVRGACSR